MPTSSTPPSRRRFLRLCLGAPAATLLAACSGAASGSPTPAPAARVDPTAAAATVAPVVTAAPPEAPTPAATAGQPAPNEEQAAPAATLAPTPACPDDDDVTPAQTEGPYFTSNSPERASLLEPGITGTRLVLAGHVLSVSCAPIAGALIDVWHCDDAGVYDNAGYRLRGHLFTDAQGSYRLETIVPGRYPGRTRHVHVKVQAPNGPILTTQLYFPDEPDNASDGIFQPELLLDLREVADGKEGGFTFVLA
jgi:protocatechuate 3,4-dioxygenase beta subunit